MQSTVGHCIHYSVWLFHEQHGIYW